MKKLICILLVLACAGCKKDTADTSDYGISLSKWNNYKTSIHNSYSYINFFYVTIGINPTYNETKITVKNGVIVGREYATHYITMPNGTPQYTYTETQTDLGTHTEGGELLTIDDIYTKAKNVWLKSDPSHGPGILETNNNGLISTVGYTITGIPESNFVGIHIKSITPL